MNATNSIPKKSDAFLSGIDIFYTQFNDINFYVEDIDQENFYLVILKTLFPDLKFIKVFPLNGKKNVIEKNKKNIGSKNKIFIVDKDFDDLLGKKKTYPNIFYLQKYSIENYLLEREAFITYIIDERPKLKVQEVERTLKWDANRKICIKMLKELTTVYILIQYYKLGIKNCKQPLETLISLNPTIAQKQPQYSRYLNLVEQRLQQKSARYKLLGRQKFIKNTLLFTDDELFKNMPGKYLIKIYKATIERKYSLASRNIDSFNIRIAKYCKFESLTYLKEEINTFIRT